MSLYYFLLGVRKVMKYNRDWLYDLKINNVPIKTVMTDEEKYGEFISFVTSSFINNINLKDTDDIDEFIAEIIKSSLYLVLTSKFLADITQYKLSELIGEESVQQFISDAYDIIDKDLTSKDLFAKETSN